LSEKPIKKSNRESVAHHVRTYFAAWRDDNAAEGYTNDLEDVYNPSESMIYF